MAGALKRKLTFSAWADGVKKENFDPAAAAAEIAEIEEDDLVYEHGDSLTAVEVVDDGSDGGPVKLQLLALHDADNAPSSWGPGAGATQVDYGDGRCSAFLMHVVIWDDKVVAHDAHANAPRPRAARRVHPGEHGHPACDLSRALRAGPRRSVRRS